jgi:positive regulator of sigma E activity
MMITISVLGLAAPFLFLLLPILANILGTIVLGSKYMQLLLIILSVIGYYGVGYWTARKIARMHKDLTVIFLTHGGIATTKTKVA